MGYNFPEGSAFYFSNTLAAAKTISAVTNANPAVATSTAHGYVDNDEVLFDSGWEDADDTVFRVNQLTADTFELLGLNSIDTSWFAAGTGIGETRKLSGWTEIPQVLGIATQGGDPRFTPVSPLKRRNSIQVPTGFNPMSITLTLGHDPADAIYASMLNISRTLAKVAFKVVQGGGGSMYGYGHLAVGEIPAMNQGQVNTVPCVITFLGRPISYST